MLGYPIPHLDGVPHPRSRWGTPSQVWIGVTLFQVQMGRVPHPRSRQGVPCPRSGWEGVPHPRSGLEVPYLNSRWGTPIPGLDGGVTPSQVQTGGGTLSKIRMGVPQCTPCPRLDGVPPCPRLDRVPLHPRLDGVPPPPSAKQALSVWQAVCLLHSRRRTFLLVICTQDKI